MTQRSLKAAVEDLWARYDDGHLDATRASAGDRDILEDVLDGLESGSIRAAERHPDGGWEPNRWVKQAIRLAFALSPTQAREVGDVTYHDVMGLRETADLGRRGVRNTPDGTVVRRGAAIGDDAILMSPSFVNVGARVGAGTLVDSCTTVGSCAQVGEGVKLGANTLVGGVLEPVEDAPVVIEDGVSLGAGSRVTSGFVVRQDCVVGENTLLTPRIPVYDLVEEAVLVGELPAERRAFARFVESSVGEHDLFGGGGAYKPAVVATALEDHTLERSAREEVLRS